MMIRKIGIEEKRCSRQPTKCYFILYSLENPIKKYTMMHTNTHTHIYNLIHHKLKNVNAYNEIQVCP